MCPHVLLCDPMAYSTPGCSVHVIAQTRILEWVATSQPNDQARVSCVSCIGRQILYHCPTWEVLLVLLVILSYRSVFVFFCVFFKVQQEISQIYLPLRTLYISIKVNNYLHLAFLLCLSSTEMLLFLRLSFSILLVQIYT